MKPDKWEKTAPFKPGWYWAKMKFDSSGDRCIPLRIDNERHVRFSSGETIVRMPADVLPCEWIHKPIKEPK